MRITTRVNGHEVPRNAGLLFFSRDPTRWFRGAKIEVVQFISDRAGDVQEERTFSGTLVEQLRDCLNYLKNFSANHVQKQRDRRHVRSWISYPLPALRETLVNAVYHRSYEVDQPEPTKVYLYPSRVDVTSYPGPVPGIEHHHLTANARVPSAPARNRRIGEFLKELGLAEGRLSGIPKVFRAMAENGSPEPSFDFDEQRTYFQVTLPTHPEYGALSALRDAAHLRALGEHEEAFRRIEAAWYASQTSNVLSAEMVCLQLERGEIGRSHEVIRTFGEQTTGSEVAIDENVWTDALCASDYKQRALNVLRLSLHTLIGQDAFDAAILARRVGDSHIAHEYFENTGKAVYGDARALLAFAQTKLDLAQDAHRERQHDSNRRLLTEARTLLERLIQLEASPTRHAWAWRELARSLNWLRAPVKDIESAYRKAIELLPDERQFEREMEDTLAARR